MNSIAVSAILKRPDLSLASTIDYLTLSCLEAAKLALVEDEIRGTTRIKKLKIKWRIFN